MDMEPEAKFICLKLITGEVVMGLLESENDDYYNLEEPVNLSYDFDQDGNFGLKFIPFMSFCGQKLFTFNRRYIIMALEPKPETIEFYNEFQLFRVEEDDDTSVIDFSGIFDKKKLH